MEQLKLPLLLPVAKTKWYTQNKWKRRNPDKVKADKRKWNVVHAVAHRADARRWALEHPEEKKAISRRCYYKNRERFLANAKARTKKLRLEIITSLGGACACCGDTTFEFLTIDHINGGGKQHRRQYSGNSVYVIIRREGYPKDKYRVLCMDCNFSLGAWGYCPHEKQSPLAVGLC